MQKSEPPEITTDYRVVGETTRRQPWFGPDAEPIISPGGLGRLFWLFMWIFVAMALNAIIGPIIRRLGNLVFGWLGL
jgi:hypothetical protein